MNKNNIINALLFYLLWLFFGGAFSSWMIEQFLMASIGGVFEPPALWSFARDLGMITLPLLSIFGGAPAAIQIIRKRPWKKVAVVSLLTYLAIHLALMTIVIWGPPLWGWTW